MQNGIFLSLRSMIYQDEKYHFIGMQLLIEIAEFLAMTWFYLFCMTYVVLFIKQLNYVVSRYTMKN